MTIANCLENENEYVSPEYANEDVRNNKTLNLNKYPESIDRENSICEKYNPKFIVNLLAEKHLRGRLCFYFYDRADFMRPFLPDEIGYRIVVYQKFISRNQAPGNTRNKSLRKNSNKSAS